MTLELGLAGRDFARLALEQKCEHAATVGLWYECDPLVIAFDGLRIAGLGGKRDAFPFILGDVAFEELVGEGRGSKGLGYF